MSRWLYSTVLIPPLAAVVTILIAPEPDGHWSEHLWQAYLDAAQLVLICALAFLLARSMSVVLAIALALAAVGIVLQIMGNHQVAESIWQTRRDPGFGDGYNEGHDRAGQGDLLVVVAGAAFAFVAGLTKRVPLKLAGLGLAMVVIPPPFLWPAAGVLVLLLYGLTTENRFEPATGLAQPIPARPNLPPSEPDR